MRAPYLRCRIAAISAKRPYTSQPVRSRQITVPLHVMMLSASSWSQPKASLRLWMSGNCSGDSSRSDMSAARLERPASPSRGDRVAVLGLLLDLLAQVAEVTRLQQCLPHARRDRRGIQRAVLVDARVDASRPPFG